MYVDKKDDSLPPYTSRETAAILRSRIQQAKKFILLATRNSKGSLWMPWELGLSDGYKSLSNTAVLPSPDMITETKWAEQEYLGVYDRIVYGSHADYPNDIYMVWNQESNTATELSAWLKR